MTLDLPLIWAGLIAFAVFAYVVLDGFDLGIGILFPFYEPGKPRDTLMNSVAPVWDGNETWLILGGGGLFAAFPLAYAVVMPALYAPVIAMLLSLVFRGTAFEFRWRTVRARWAWDLAFSAGSAMAAFSQGVILGALLQGIPVAGRAYAGGWWDWLSPFSLLTGLSVVAGYGLLGATWLVMKTEHEIQAQAYHLSWRMGGVTLAAIIAVSGATPFLDGHYWQRWFTFPTVLATAQVPLLVAITAGGLVWTLKTRKERWPFLLTLVLYALCFMGLGISIFPDIVPGRISIWEAASPPISQGFMLIGAAILIPVILCYTAYGYWVFRGKVKETGYH
ncbi:MAG TPA: cytochrome d ubiquinol oxidase subunit II [Magnetospirillaceae bacterium]|nr:cytochrome d ubiquinol oxidase subunit II [Magnetospirillaceae bacterium]